MTGGLTMPGLPGATWTPSRQGRPQGDEEGVLTGTGTDHENAHSAYMRRRRVHLTGPA